MEATQTSQTPQAAAPPAPRTETKRYLALDAYRGFIMLLLASEGFGFAELRNDATWGRVASWFNNTRAIVLSIQRQLPGLRPGLPILAERTRGVAPHVDFSHLHDSGNPLRKFCPSDHHSVGAALGRIRRAGDAPAVSHRLEHLRICGTHHAGWHR